MMTRTLPILRRSVIAVAVCAAMFGLTAHAAQARVWVGIGIPFPGYYYPPPVYYPPPPVYYAPPPPPVVYSPQPAYTPQPAYSAPQQNGSRQICYAGNYSCPMDNPTQPGARCYCLGNGGQKVWGQAN